MRCNVLNAEFCYEHNEFPSDISLQLLSSSVSENPLLDSIIDPVTGFPVVAFSVASESNLNEFGGAVYLLRCGDYLCVEWELT